MKKKWKMTANEYKEYIRNNVRGSRSSKGIQDSHKKHSTYIRALEILRDLQSTGGSMFLGQDTFELEIQKLRHSTTDKTNVYKGCEDGLNKIAYGDDKQREDGELHAWCQDLFEGG